MLTNRKNAVQGAIRIFQVDDEGNPIPKGTLLKYLNQELPVYYYLGNYFNMESNLCTCKLCT